MYSKIFKNISGLVENLRIQIYNDSKLNIDDAEDKSELDDLLFSIQSKLGFDVCNILDCYEEEE